MYSCISKIRHIDEILIKRKHLKNMKMHKHKHKNLNIPHNIVTIFVTVTKQVYCTKLCVTIVGLNHMQISARATYVLNVMCDRSESQCSWSGIRPIDAIWWRSTERDNLY